MTTTTTTSERRKQRKEVIKAKGWGEVLTRSQRKYVRRVLAAERKAKTMREHEAVLQKRAEENQRFATKLALMRHSVQMAMPAPKPVITPDHGWTCMNIIGGGYYLGPCETYNVPRSTTCSICGAKRPAGT